jgi:dihydrofolate synthase/folylpolyglutamate synthase
MVAHVGGTSGKGSTAWMLAAMLSRQHRTGLVTSPHLFDMRERIRVDMEPISREDLERVFEGTVVPACERLVGKSPEHALLFPEVILATAFAHFVEARVEWAVVEVAVGGRYDQSNLVTPAASLVTNVSRDHMHQLGNRIEDIARHKAGIAKPGVPLYTSETKEVVLAILREEARAVGAPFHQVVPEDGKAGGIVFRGRTWPVAMRGGHQRYNAALALAVALDVARVPEEECAEALSTARMPGRFEEVGPGVFADIAHNAAKMRALAETAKEELAGRRAVLVVGIARRKEHAPMLRALLPVADSVVFTRSRYRGADPGRLMRIWKSLGSDPARAEVVPRPRDALARARQLAGTDGAIVVTGSTFVVDEALNPDDWLMEANAVYVPPGKVYVKKGEGKGG